MRTLAKDIAKSAGSAVTVSGWLHKKRDMGGLSFINLRDRTGLVQVLIENEAEQAKLKGLQMGTVLSVTGTVITDERAPGGAEIHEPVLEIISPVTAEPPIEIDKPLSHKSENLDTLFNYRVLGLRNLQERAIFKIQGKVLEAARQYFKDNDFAEFNSPKILAEATEGGAEVFKVDYFGKTAVLAQSAQFYKQIMVGVFERVFETNPTYRAEPSYTTRHMSEYITIDAEMGFVNFEELRDFAGGLIIFVSDYVWKSCEAELKMWNATKPTFPEKIPAITMAEVHEMFSKANNVDTTSEPDLSPEEERWISEYAEKQLGSEAVFITDWPVSSMKFYHKVSDKDPAIAERSDLLFRGIEIATVPMREHRYEVLVQQLKDIAHGDPEHPGYGPYLSAFKFGLPPHGGFGLGLERLTEKIIGLQNVKEATLFPRDVKRLTP